MTSLAYGLRSRIELRVAKPAAVLALACAALAVGVLASAMLGAAPVPLAQMSAAVRDAAHPLHGVLWNVRIPRILAGAAVGASLAVAGALLQTVVRNPLADPGLLGVSAGAGLGALLAILVFPSAGASVAVFAFVGGVATIGVLLALAWNGSRTAGPLRLVLSGVALQAVLFAAIALLMFTFADRAPSFVGFMVGSLAGSGWSDVTLAAVPCALGIALAASSTRTLDLLLLDDAAAASVGLPVRSARFAISCLSALLAAAAVSVAGLVGFVGLVVPNAVRLLVGPEHRRLLPCSIALGAALVVVADLAARMALAPLELPVGALLSLLGGPYFLFVLWRKLP